MFFWYICLYKRLRSLSHQNVRFLCLPVKSGDTIACVNYVLSAPEPSALDSALFPCSTLFVCAYPTCVAVLARKVLCVKACYGSKHWGIVTIKHVSLNLKALLVTQFWEKPCQAKFCSATNSILGCVESFKTLIERELLLLTNQANARWFDSWTKAFQGFISGRTFFVLQNQVYFWRNLYWFLSVNAVVELLTRHRGIWLPCDPLLSTGLVSVTQYSGYSWTALSEYEHPVSMRHAMCMSISFAGNLWWFCARHHFVRRHVRHPTGTSPFFLWMLWRENTIENQN